MKKHSFAAGIFCLLLLLQSIGVFAQTAGLFQRIGIAAGQELVLNTGEVTGSVASVCMDLSRHSPGTYDLYGEPKPKYRNNLTPTSAKVYIGNSSTPISLPAAVSNGYIRYTIDDFAHVDFHRGPNAHGKIRIIWEKPGILANAGDKVTAYELERLAHPPTPDIHFPQLDLQSYIWYGQNDISYAQNFLHQSGFYNGPIDNKASSVSDAVEKFYQTFNIPPHSAWNSEATEQVKFLVDRITREAELGTIEQASGLVFLDENGINYFVREGYGDTKSIYIKARLAGDGRVEWIGEGQADAQFWTSINESIAKKNARLSTSSVTTLSVSSFGTGMPGTLQIGDEVTTLTLSSKNHYQEILSEMNRKITTKNLKTVTLLVDGHANIMEGTYDRTIANRYGREFINTSRLAHDLAKANPGSRIFISTDPEHFSEKISTLPGLKGRKDIKLVLPERSFNSTDIISDAFLQQLADKGLDYTKATALSPIESLGSNVMIFSGDKGYEFYQFISSQAAGKKLQGKILLLFSCQKEGDIAFYSRLLGQEQVKAIYSYPFNVDPGAVKLVLKQLAPLVDKEMSAAEFIQAFQTAVDKALEAAINEPERIRGEIIKLREFNLQVMNRAFTPSISLS